MIRLYRNTSRSIFALCLLTLALSFTVIAQDLDDVTIRGNVSDSNGDAIAGAAITITSVTTGSKRTVVSNGNGRYKVIELPPGVYKIKVSAGGFGTKETNSVEIISAQNLRLNFSLSPATVTAEQTITIS